MTPKAVFHVDCQLARKIRRWRDGAERRDAGKGKKKKQMESRRRQV